MKESDSPFPKIFRFYLDNVYGMAYDLCFQSKGEHRKAKPGEFYLDGALSEVKYITVKRG